MAGEEAVSRHLGGFSRSEMLQSREATVWFQGPRSVVPLLLHMPCVSACFLQREKHKLSPTRSQQIHVRKVRTRKEEWERRKMGIEFMSDARTLEQAGSTKEDRAPRGFVILLSALPPVGCLPCFGHRERMCSPPTDHVSCNRAGSTCPLLTSSVQLWPFQVPVPLS